MRVIRVDSLRNFFQPFKVVRTQGFADLVLFPKPLAEIEQATSLGAEWTVLCLKPFAALAAGRTFYRRVVAHDSIKPSFLSFGGIVATQ